MFLGRVICNSNRTEWSTIQGVIGRVISNLKLQARLLPGLYDKVQLLIINCIYNKIREEYDSGINHLTG